MGETIVGGALEPFRNEVKIATKFGFDFTDKGGLNSRPDHIKRMVDGCLKRLRTDRIPIFRLNPLGQTTSSRSRFTTLRSSAVRFASGRTDTSGFPCSNSASRPMVYIPPTWKPPLRKRSGKKSTLSIRLSP